MNLTPAQQATLRAYILGQSDLVAIIGSVDQLTTALNINAVPNFWVWRKSVSRNNIYTEQNDLSVPIDDKFWNWTTYKNQGVSEQNAWVQMFMQDVTDFSAQNVRDGIAKIFTGSAAATAQRNHILAIGRRLASRVERVFQTGAGTTANPDILVTEGPITQNEVIQVLSV